MKITQERLNELAHSAGLEPCDSDPVYDGVMVGEIVAMAKELLAHRKAWGEPICYVNASDIKRKELHVLARLIESKACTLPLYRKPDTGAA